MPADSRPGWARRLRFLREQFESRSLPALVVTSPINLRYLTGFHGSAGMLLVTPGGATLIADGRYDTAVRLAVAAGTMADVEVERVAQRYDLTLVEVARRFELKCVGFEAGHVTVATLDGWRRAESSIEWVSTDDVVERQRIIKDEQEIALFRRAGPVLAGVAQRLHEWVRAGRTEREIARDIDGGISEAGFSDVAFPTIVASGPNSALPHARPGDWRLQAGDLVVLDFGGVLDGYCVDLTRMAGIGPVGSEAMALVTAVQAAQREAIAAVRPGQLGADVDQAARSVLDRAGLGPAFLHGTGHGLGLEVHEAPRVSRNATSSNEMLQPGMVCTIEPGAYIEGLGGARVEDDVLVTASGCEVLTEAPRDLLVV